MKSDDILITGATGFVGRNLVPALLRDGRTLVLAVRDTENVVEAWRHDQRIRIVATGPIESATNLPETLAGVSTVVHLAGLAHVRHSETNDDPFVAANANATERLAQAAAECGVASFIHMSSVFAVTDNASPVTIHDETDFMPSTSYGRSKRMAEKHVLALAAAGMFGISLRPTLIIGVDAGGNWRALQRLAASGLPLPFASVRNRRSLVAVDSVVKVIAHLCARHWPHESSGSYNLADRGAISLPQIVTNLRSGMGMPPRLIPFPPSLIRSMAALLRQQGRVNGLLGNLEVDARRFAETFGFEEFPDVHESVRNIGSQYSRPAARNR